MDDLVAGDLTIEAVEHPGTDPIRLNWKGKSNDRHPGKVLGAYFGNILAVAAQRKVPVEMHFEKLEHINSSTIASVIQLIQEARQKDVKLVLVYDDSLRWQKVSFDALRVLANDANFLQLRSA